jgi:hypothetical protein
LRIKKGLRVVRQRGTSRKTTLSRHGRRVEYRPRGDVATTAWLIACQTQSPGRTAAGNARGAAQLIEAQRVTRRSGRAARRRPTPDKRRQLNYSENRFDDASGEVRMFRRILLAAIVGCLGGCEKSAGPNPDRAEPAAVAESSAAPRPSPIRTPEALHAALKAKNPAYNGAAQMQANGETIVALDLRDTGVVDLTPLTGLHLQQLYAENTAITDLTPLKGMRLLELSLSDTPVADIHPLRGMPLESVRLVNTKVRDISALQGAPLRELWLNNAPVSDASVLAGMPLVSVTLEGTQVSDIGFVRRCPNLERLNLAGAPVADLSPVAGLRLTRLVFDPKQATKGLDAARSLPLCREIGPTMETMGPPGQFWPAYDAGAFR